MLTTFGFHTADEARASDGKGKLHEEIEAKKTELNAANDKLIQAVKKAEEVAQTDQDAHDKAVEDFAITTESKIEELESKINELSQELESLDQYESLSLEVEPQP